MSPSTLRKVSTAGATIDLNSTTTIPLLACLWLTLPLLNPKWQVEVQKLPDSFRITSITPDPEAPAWRARGMNVLLGLLLAWMVWRVVDQLFSRSAANFALALLAFSPSLIAHFSIASTDGAATLFIFSVAWFLIVWRRGPTWQKPTVLLGLLLGLTLLVKFSTAPMVVLAAIWMLLLGQDKLLLPVALELAQDWHGTRSRPNRGLGGILLPCFAADRP